MTDASTAELIARLEDGDYADIDEVIAALRRLQAAERERDKAHHMTGLAIEDYNDEKARAEAAERIPREPTQEMIAAAAAAAHKHGGRSFEEFFIIEWRAAYDAAQGAQDTPGDA